MPPKSESFTVTSNGGLLRVLKTQCAVSEAFDPDTTDVLPPELKMFEAIWDTGATGSVITQRVVDGCKLSPIGMVEVHGVNGKHMAEVYLVNIGLPNTVGISGLRVTKGNLAPGVDVLIGMDIIQHGDFAVTNHNGRTVFSFRLPSERHIDFVKEHKAAAQREQITHGGKGKKKRQKRSKQFGKNKKK